ncbi:MAG: hypothetical protein ACKVS9_06430 [Phycisphaerae bacterium]
MNRSCSRPSSNSFSRTRWHRKLIVALAVAAACPVLATPPLYYVEILDVPAGRSSGFPYAISPSGQVVGIAGDDRYDPAGLPMRVEPGVLDPLGQLFDSNNYPVAIASADLIVGSTISAPCVWNSGVPQLLPALPGWFNGEARGVSTTGAAVGWFTNDFAGYSVPVYWAATDETPVQLPDPNGSSESSIGGAHALNAAGQICGYVGFEAGFVGARWDSPTAAAIVIGPLAGASLSEVIAINAAGDTCGRSSYEDSSVQAMAHLRAENQLVALGWLGTGNYSFARGINSSRQIVGDSNDGNGALRAFIWQDGVMRDLNTRVHSSNVPFELLLSAVGINDAGQIAAEALVETDRGIVSRVALLTPASRVPGDIDGDGDVDLTDLAILLGQFGCAADCDADINGDNIVDLTDLAMLLAKFGTGG